MFFKRFLFVVGTVAGLAPATPALAQHRGDIVLTLSPAPDVAIVTNQFDLNGILTPGVRVFSSTFGDFGPNSTDNPGFDSMPGAFPFPSSNSFRIRRALRMWNGADFSTIPPERIAVAFNILGPVYTPLMDEIVDGFGLAVGSNGEWHKHLEYTLTDPAEDGVYLLEMDLASSDPGIGRSLPFWIVFNQDAPQEEADAAAQWVRDNLANPPMCPADWNRSGGVNSQDFFDFLGDFFGGEADFNSSGTTDSQDFFDFLTAFFGGC